MEGITIKVEEVVWQFIMNNKKMGESHNETLKRLLEIKDG